MFWAVSVFKAGIFITCCTLNASGSLEAINRIEAEAKSWPIILADENEQQSYSYRAYEFQARLIP
jgi:hypothetical protein